MLGGTCTGRVHDEFKQIFINVREIDFSKDGSSSFVVLTRAGDDMTDQPKVQENARPDGPNRLRRDATPTLFADGLLGGSIESGVVRLELLARHFDPDSKSLSAALVGRIVMPQANFATFVAALAELAKQTAGSKEKNS